MALPGLAQRPPGVGPQLQAISPRSAEWGLEWARALPHQRPPVPEHSCCDTLPASPLRLKPQSACLGGGMTVLPAALAAEGCQPL